MKLCRQVQADGLTIVPLKIYFKNSVAKLLIGLAKGRSKGDKREAIAKREVKRDIDRALSRRR
jgi:SsrA-binding protein